MNFSLFFIILSVSVAVAFIVFINLLLWRQRKIIKEHADRIDGLQKTLAGKKEVKDLNVEKASDTLLNGLVEKKTTVTGNRSVSNYSVTSALPKFSTIQEALTFASGILYSNLDPTVARIAPWGSVVKMDDYAALRVTMAAILDEISKIK